MKFINKGNPIVKARRTMREAFIQDPGFELAYVANIAMLLYDHYNKADFKDYNTRNQAAKDLLKLIFWR